jgi:hypothetical protein
MKKKHWSFVTILTLVFASGIIYAALIVPNEIQQPGTQPREVGNLETPDKCDNCHGGYNPAVEPGFNWRGSMMANAGRDPIFWATLAVAEQDFDGAGDLCIRCHSTAGWLGGRSTPTDGSGLAAGDADGVECDFCHKLTNPDNSELQGVMNPPFVANDNGDPGPPTPPYIGTGYYGSGMASLWPGNEKLGPYADTVARHQFIQSAFHRSKDFCGTCHDVSNPAVGDLAPNNGTQDGYPWFVTADGQLDILTSPLPPVDRNAAFNNFPYMYGIVERTYSEYWSGALSTMLVSDYATLPPELQAGAIRAAYDSAMADANNLNSPDYVDGTERTFTCQTCHLRPVTGAGCNKKGAPTRPDLPLHDMTGGNYWMPEAIKYLDSKGKLLLGGGLTPTQIAALDDGVIRVKKQLSEAVTLQVDEQTNTVRVVNLTGHKLISGYPEGRRMWLNIKWEDKDGNLLREDGAYGPLVDALGDPIMDPLTGMVQVESILNLNGPNTKIYEAHYGMTKEWASKLISLGYPDTFPLSFDRLTGAVDYTLRDLADSSPGTYHETFHFVLNNYVAKDNRLPPFGMSYDEAQQRNALPVPADQYGNPGPGGTYNYWDEVALKPPAGAVYAKIDMLYQPTSWEYIQFLYLANNRQNPFLADEGVNLLDAWLNATPAMAFPFIMASAEWGKKVVPPLPKMSVGMLTTWSVDRKGNLVAVTNTFAAGDTVAIVAHVLDEHGIALSGAQLFVELVDITNTQITTLQGFTDPNGDTVLTWKSPRRTTMDVTANVTDVIKNGYVFDPALGQTSVMFSVR